jgi:hypothetical protein
MRITVDISGYYDWVPVPPGTQITHGDVESLRVKKMTDESWHMKIAMKCDTETPQHHDVGVHEEAICKRMAALEKLGRPETREQVASFELQGSFRHHLSPSHMLKINVHDDGPNEEMYKRALEEAGVTDPKAVADAMERYLETVDMEEYLNVVFKTAHAKSKGKKKS